MEIILLSVIVGLLIVVVTLLAGAFFLKWLAEENILFTTVREGTAKAIMRGKSFDRFIMSFAGYHLNSPGRPGYRSGPEYPDYEVIYHGAFEGKEMEDAYYDDRFRLLKHLGLYWVGWPWANSVYVYAFEWNDTIPDKKTGEEKIFPRAEATDFIFVADFTYAIKTAGAETKDRLPTDEFTLVTAAVRNPYRALFSGENWMQHATAAINRHVRDYVGGMDFQDLISVIDRKAFSVSIIELNRELPDDVAGEDPHGLEGRYGIIIRTADLQTIDLSGDEKVQAQKAAMREYLARQEAKATLLKGQAEADVTEMKGMKEAVALRTRLDVIKEYGEAGIMLAGYDALQETSKGTGNTIVWANSPLTTVAEPLKPTKNEKP